MCYDSIMIYKKVRPKFDLTGQRFGRLVALGAVGRRPNGIVWKCKCDCGKTTSVPACNLRCGGTRSCGCLKHELLVSANPNRSHGLKWEIASNKRLRQVYHAWVSMKQRCHNPKNANYKQYGARGIYVCKKWRHDFVAFLKDIGLPPKRKLTIDRLDNDGPYEPGNCSWATPFAQGQNRRTKQT